MKDVEYLYGRRVVQEFLDSRHDPSTVKKCYFRTGLRHPLVSRLRRACPGAAFLYKERAELDELVDGAHHQGIVLEFRAADYPGLSSGNWRKELQKREGPYLCLDRIMDPQNLGAILRTAEALGVKAVFLSGKGAKINSIVHRIASGASLHLSIHSVGNLSRFCNEAKKTGLWICVADAPEPPSSAKGAETSKHSLKNAPLRIRHTETERLPEASSLVLVIGSEGEGLRPLALKESDFVLSIPHRGKTASLNAGVAAAVLLERMIFG